MMDDDKVTISGYDNQGGFKQDTILGLQVNKQVNDSTNVTGQLVSRGGEDYNTESAWAYVSYAASDNLDLRLGRLRVPFYYYSDFLEVGYAYDWVRPPEEVYNIPFSSVDGTDLNYRFSTADIDHSLQLYYGRFELDSGLELKNFAGTALTSTMNDFSTRLSYHRIEIGTVSGSTFAGQVAGAGIGIDLSKPLLNAQGYSDAEVDTAKTDFVVQGEESGFYGLALGYDNGDISLIGELTQGFAGTPFFPASQSYLVKLGKRFNDMTAHLTYTARENDLESGIDGAIQKVLGFEDKQNSIIAGLRYDYASSTAIKFEVQQHNEEIVSGQKVDESGMLYSIALDLVF